MENGIFLSISKYTLKRHMFALYVFYMVKKTVGERNVCDPLTLSIGDIMRLYARRWDIEIC
jgi:hypothetical protein